MSGLENQKTTTEERDINEIFDDIVLTEDRLREEGFKEGYAEGCIRGNQEGYQLGYAQGVQLGQELGNIYGQIVAELQFKHTEKVKRALLQLRQAIDDFPRDNDANKDIIGAIENIRTLNKRLQIMLNNKRKIKINQTEESETKGKKDFTF